MGADAIITEADILADVLAADTSACSAEVASAILRLRFSERALTRMRDLVTRSHEDALSAAETDELERYRRVGLFLDLLHARAASLIAADEERGK